MAKPKRRPIRKQQPSPPNFKIGDTIRDLRTGKTCVVETTVKARVFYLYGDWADGRRGELVYDPRK